MNSIDYKLSDAEKKDLISKCSIKGSSTYSLAEITPLPYGYLFCFKDKQGYGNAFAVNISNNGKDVEVAPSCNFAAKLECFLKEYFQKHKEFK
jgi:hypothetical protein